MSNDGREDLLCGAGRDVAVESVVKSFDYSGTLAQLPNEFRAFGAYTYGANVSGGGLGY